MRSFTYVVALGVIAALAGACKEKPEATPTRTAATTSSPATLAEATFDVRGMTCASCNVAVKVAAEKVPGVRHARASHDEKRAWATFDPTRTTPEAIATAITNAGYEATLVAGAPSAGSPSPSN